MKIDRPLGAAEHLEPAYQRREVAEVIRRLATARADVERRDETAVALVAAAMRRESEGER